MTTEERLLQYAKIIGGVFLGLIIVVELGQIIQRLDLLLSAVLLN